MALQRDKSARAHPASAFHRLIGNHRILASQSGQFAYDSGLEIKTATARKASIEA
jgi:hypothetical protein